MQTDRQRQKPVVYDRERRYRPPQHDPLQVAAQIYPWMYMNSSLDASFQSAESSARTALETRRTKLSEEEAEIADQRVRFEAERTVAFYEELASSTLAKEAPSIIQTFIRHGDACAEANADALRLANHGHDHATPLLIQQYNDLSAKLERLRAEATRLESSIERLLQSNEDQPPSQVLSVFAACLPIVRARVGNLSSAHDLVLCAKDNMGMSLRIESLFPIPKRTALILSTVSSSLPPRPPIVSTEPSPTLPFMSAHPYFPDEPLLATQEEGAGYYPARPGDLLSRDRYKIIGKLGWGRHSSTWVVANVEAEGIEGKTYHAAKFLTAHATQQNKDGRSSELRIMQTVQSLDGTMRSSSDDVDDDYEFDDEDDSDYFDIEDDESSFPPLPQLIDTFEVQGPHGNHICLITGVFATDIYSTNIDTFQQTAPSKKLPLHTVKIIIGLLLSPLARLHDTGIIHTHVTPGKVWFPQGIDDAQLEPHFTTPPTENEGDVEINGVKYPIVRSKPIQTSFLWNDEEAKVKSYSVHLTSLGHGQYADTIDVARVRTPYPYRAPEIVLHAGFDSKVDIWAVGCMVFQLLTGRPCFTPEAGSGWSIEEDYLAKAMQFTGETFPAELLVRSQLRVEYFTESGNLKRVEALAPISIEEALADATTLSPDQVAQTAAFIRDCMHLDPERRPPARVLDLYDWLMGASMCADYRNPEE